MGGIGTLPLMLFLSIIDLKGTEDIAFLYTDRAFYNDVIRTRFIVVVSHVH